MILGMEQPKKQGSYNLECIDELLFVKRNHNIYLSSGEEIHVTGEHM